MKEGFDAISGGEGAPADRPHVRALRAAYRGGRLVVSADSATLTRARLERGHAIDARDVAEAMLCRMLGDSVRGAGGGPPAS